MDLHVTLAAGPGVRLAEDDRTEEIVITRAHLTSGEELHTRLAKRTGALHLFVNGTPLRELEPGVPPLTSGAVIVATTGDHVGARPVRPIDLFFLVRSGPDAGKAVPLSRGTYTIGRSAADISIEDPKLSRTHAVLTVTDDALILRDRDSANGVWVDGSKVARTAVTTESDIHMGSSRCALVLADVPAEPLLSVDLSKPCVINAPTPPEGSPLLILTAFLPLVLGIVLAVTTGMWFFLAFSALSAVTGLVPLINGRRKRRAFDAAVAAAVTEDRERRRRAAPEAGGLTLASLSHGLTAHGQTAPLQSGGSYLRIGIADQTANIEVTPRPPQWRPPKIAGAPVLIPLVDPGSEEPLNLDVRGPQQTLIRAAHLLLLQLSALQEAGEILCFGPAQQLPSAARFLGRVTLVAHPARLGELLATGRYSTLLLFGSAPLVQASNLRIYRFSTSTRYEDEGWTVDYFMPEPLLRTPDRALCFQPDLVRTETFDVLARANGARALVKGRGAADAPISDAVSLRDLISCETGSIVERWRTLPDATRLGTCIGSSASGPLLLDLVAHGPHVLVAGTTGSGKSEFLRTLVLALALNHSPADLNFLFIDFKGGSGLGCLDRLPHATGMHTDLSAAAVSRALISLRAEVKRRETLFADAGAVDYFEYCERSSAKLPRLVTVIDEFRMLSEEVPGSVHELMRIATLGRSLGMHLVLATQRPQGAITSDIRANITTSVALRMQSAGESQDVLESAVASTIPVDRPGRAYLRIASGRPTEFQAATTTQGTGSPASTITSFASFLTPEAGQDNPSESAEAGPRKTALHTTGGVQALVAAANRAAQAVTLPPVHEPVRPPLPTALTCATTVQAGILQLGLLDIPEKQEQRPLVWGPDRHSHLAFVGQPGSGLDLTLAHSAVEHLRALPDRHVYVLDGDSSLRVVADAPQVGAYVTTSQIKRAARVLERIAELVIDRMNGTTKLSKPAPLLTVFVTGWGRWATSFRSGRFAWAEDALQSIVRDGEAAGVALIIAGERELIASRFFPMVPNRLYLPLGASPEALLGWPKLPDIDAITGRAFVQGRIGAVADSVAQLVTHPGTVPSVQPTQKPFPVAVLPRLVSGSQLEPAALGLRTIRIPIGVGGDDLATICLELPHRAAALVVGAAGTGKSQTLDLVAQLAGLSVRCVRPAPDDDPQAFWKRRAALGAEPDELLLIDDADFLPRETHQQLAAMLATGARAVFACSPSAAVSTSPAFGSLGINPLGIVLGPRSPTDGDVFGLRLDVDGTPPPGRGILVVSRRSVEIQIAHADSPDSPRSHTN